MWQKFKVLKQEKYYRPVKYFLLAVLLIVFLDKCTLMPMPPWKETSPSKPGFEIENFQYEDYAFREFFEGYRTVFDKIISNLFYLNDDKETIEKVLVQYGNAKYAYLESSERHYGTGDCYKFKSSPSIEFFMNVNAPFHSVVCANYANNKLKRMTVNGKKIKLRKRND